jgi:hypothetical protein
VTQYFAYKGFSLKRAPWHTKVLITTFNVVILIALIVGLVNYWDKTGMTPAGVAAWYRGNESSKLSSGEEMVFEKTFRELMDATHPHLFGQGILLFILSHVVALSGLKQRTKALIYLTSFGAMLLDAGVPWLIRYVSPALAPVQILSILGLTGAFLAQLWVPVQEMWFARDAQASFRSGRGAQIAGRHGSRAFRGEGRLSEGASQLKPEGQRVNGPAGATGRRRRRHRGYRRGKGRGAGAADQFRPVVVETPAAKDGEAS